ncbi:alcohol dehydrogenase, partial [Proteus mirabilis]
MAVSTFYIPSVNKIGAGCLADAVSSMKDFGFHKALIVTDSILNQLGVVDKVSKLLTEAGISSVTYDGTAPNPT